MKIGAFVLGLVATSFFLTDPAAGQATSNPFETSFLSAHLPVGWKCELRGREWVCQDKQQRSPNKALILLSAKIAAPEDNLENFARQLNQPRINATQPNATLRSKVIEVKSLQINNHPWVMGLHLDSEIENYYSRYFTTTNQNLAILVNFTVHRDWQKYYEPQFKAMAESLRPKMVQSPQTASDISTGEPTSALAGLTSDETPPPFTTNHVWLVVSIFLIITMAGLYLVWKKR